MIREMSRDGKSLLLTTHNMQEAEELCDRINIIVGGRIVAMGTITDLKDAIRNRSIIEVEVRRLIPGIMDTLRSLDGVDGVTSITEPYRSILRIQVSDERDMVLPIASRLGDSHIIRISKEEPTLEDAYLSMVSGDA